MSKKAISGKGKRNRFFVGICLLLIIGIFVKFGLFDERITIGDGAKKIETKETKTVTTKKKVTTVTGSKILQVPLLNQMDAPILYNGCEVTSLAMILNYFDVSVTKNQLGDAIDTVPYQYEDGTYGNPNDGFVGSITGSSVGYGVYHGPIVKLAKKYLTKELQVRDITDQSFNKILSEVKKGNPVWVITTVTMAATNDMKTWETPTGTASVSWSMHSVVVTGYDDDSIYVNDPYGVQNKKVDRTDFIASWKQMGSQAVVISKK